MRHALPEAGSGCQPFLRISLDYLGAIPQDDYVPMAVSQQRPSSICFPRAGQPRISES